MQLDGTVQQIRKRQLKLSAPMEKTNEIAYGLSKESPLIHLKDVEGNSVLLPDEVSQLRKLAQTLKIKAGDMIELKRTNKGYIRVPANRFCHLATGQECI